MFAKSFANNHPLFFQSYSEIEHSLTHKRAFVSQIRHFFRKTLEKTHEFGYNIKGLSRK